MGLKKLRGEWWWGRVGGWGVGGSRCEWWRRQRQWPAWKAVWGSSEHNSLSLWWCGGVVVMVVWLWWWCGCGGGVVVV